jgi:hypothetical protein
MSIDLAFYGLCREAFPDISELTIAKMVAGIDVVYRHVERTRKLLAASSV